MNEAVKKDARIPWRTLTLVCGVAAVIVVTFVLWGGTFDALAQRLAAEGHEHPWRVGGILTALLAMDIVLPVPSSLASTMCGWALGFWAGLCASFAGMMVTTVAGYVAGRYAARPAEALMGADELQLLSRWQERYGVALLLILRPVPVLAETSVLFSGMLRQRFGVVLFCTAIGNVLISAVYAAIGVWGQISDSCLFACVASAGLAGVFMAVVRLKKRKGREA